MADEARNELSALRAEYKEVTGRNPAPSMDAETLRIRITEHKASGREVAPPEAPKGTAKLTHDDDNASACIHGVEIVRGTDGFFLVPEAFVEHLEPHGFRRARERA